MADSRQVARCGSGTRVAFTSTKRTSRSRGGLGFWLVLALVVSTCSSGVRGQQEDYDYGNYQQQAPMRAGGGGEGGGLMKPLAAVATSFVAMKVLFSRRRKSKGAKNLEEEFKLWEQLKREDLQQINRSFNDMEASLTASLHEKVAQSKQLEQFLYSLPDTNQDGLITRFEFDKYMNEYKRTHPGLTDLDLPRFEDMDHNNNGHINFGEWEEYQMLAMNQMQ